MGRAGPVEVREDVEIAGMAQTVSLGDAVQSVLNEVCGAYHSSHDFERREVDLGRRSCHSRMMLSTRSSIPPGLPSGRHAFGLVLLYLTYS